MEIRAARRDEIPLAAEVVARAFQDSPMTRAVWGSDPMRRLRGVHEVFAMYLPTMAEPPFLALEAGRPVGVLAMAPPGTCLRTPLMPTLRLMLTMTFRSPKRSYRFHEWMLCYERRDPPERHWHLGPVAVEPGYQGRGVGSAMLERFCARVDDDGAAAYLETDKPENVRLYERFDFTTVGEQMIAGTPNWFMLRAGRARV
jgi:predicted N-acetyltransferase YhbS